MRQILALALLVVLTASQSRAQPPSGPIQLEPIDFGMSSGIRTDSEGPVALWFTNPRIGYLLTKSQPTHRTTDGGITWSEWLTEPVIFSQLHAGFGITGPVFTEDSGLTWRSFAPNFDDPAIVNAEWHSSAVASRNHFTNLLVHNHAYYDSLTQRSYLYPQSRLVHTTNGGGSWTAIDSIVVHQSSVGTPAGGWLSLARRTRVGEFPAAPTEFTKPMHGWHQLVAMPDSYTLIAVAFVKEQLDTTRVRFHVGHIDVARGTSTWYEIPKWTRVATNASRENFDGVVNPAPGVLYARGYEMHHRSGYWERKETGYLRSSDWGRTWEPRPLPSWVLMHSVKFLTATYAVAHNAETFDGGLTWQPRANPFLYWPHRYDLATEFAYDSLHRHVLGFYSFIARSTDAGATWKHNDAGSPPHSIAAHDGVVLVGRAQRSLLQSRDYGATWHHIGRDGDLPERLNAFWSLAIPDTTDVSRVLGVASFVDPDASFRLHLVESTDSGSSWREREALPYTENAPDLLFKSSRDGSRTRGFLFGSDEVRISDDAGVTWRTTPLRIVNPRVAMHDDRDGVVATRDTVGAPWRFLATSDGAETWQPIPRPPETIT
ncbi:MAG: hypothetical protein H7X80_08530, partial [bacterium]|nr:hypothetical protein [Candidatus Kapabacteria bacterium]